MTDTHVSIHSHRPGAPASPNGILLVWDAPSSGMGLGSILGGRPRFDALGTWPTEHRELVPEATALTNVSEAGTDALRNLGVAVFATSTSAEDSDADMVANTEQQWSEGVPVTVIGVRERAAWALSDPACMLVDVAEIQQVFPHPLPRVDVDDLPPESAWLQPLRPLSAQLPHRE